MTFRLDAARIAREARIAAGLSQRELARRAGTAQSVVARIESGQTSPTTATLTRLLEAAGMDATVALAPTEAARSHMLDDVARILRLTPEQRLIEVRNLSRFVGAARRA